MSTISQTEINEVIAEIADLTVKLQAAYARRRQMFITMDATMSRRRIGAAWGISGVAVTYAINGDRFKLPKTE